MNVIMFLTPKDEIAYVTSDTTLEDTMKIMDEYRHSILPIISRDGHYAGIVSEGDIYYSIKDTYSFNPARYSDIRLCELDLRRSYSSINVNAPVEELYELSISQNFIPVTDDKDIFIGIVKRRDVLRYFFRDYKKNHPDVKQA